MPVTSLYVMLAVVNLLIGLGTAALVLAHSGEETEFGRRMILILKVASAIFYIAAGVTYYGLALAHGVAHAQA